MLSKLRIYVVVRAIRDSEERTVNLKDKYAIVGVGYTPQGRVPERTTLSFHLEACANAIDDAGLRREDIDGLIVYRHFLPPTGESDLTPYDVAQYLGLSPTYMTQDAN
jgi:acetyl-CoA acetyltransferase